ncbi:MAG TPA: hypothetical protein VME69_12855 [Methylocella sp.]|nr:hypothetical protein [Methylocella sp.]
MLFSVIGTPSALAHSGCSLVRMIADAAFGSHAFINAIYPEDIKKVWSNIDFSVTKAVVIYSSLPSKPLAELLLTTHAPTLIFSESFKTIAEFLNNAKNVDPLEALRKASQAVCSIGLVSDAYVLSITSAEFSRTLQDTIIDLCEFYNIEDPKKVASAVIKSASADPQSTFGDFVAREQFRPVPQKEAAKTRLDDLGFSFEFLAGQYAKIGLNKPNPEMTWPTGLFLDGTRAGKKITGPIDLLGPSRYLVYGPYMHLPAGDWRVIVVIEVSGNASGNRLFADVASACVPVTGVTTSLPKTGLFEFEMQFRIDDPVHPIEVRLRILEGAIEGRLWLRQVIFHPLQNAASGQTL